MSLGSLKFVVCNPCKSSPSLTILVPLWFIIIISLVFFYLIKLQERTCNPLFSGFPPVKITLDVVKITQNTVIELLQGQTRTGISVNFSLGKWNLNETLILAIQIYRKRYGSKIWAGKWVYINLPIRTLLVDLNLVPRAFPLEALETRLCRP